MLLKPVSTTIAVCGSSECVRKNSVWGTGLESLLVGAMRYCTTKKGTAAIIINEELLHQRRQHIWATCAQHDLPDVKTTIRSYLSDVISRINKNEVPVYLTEHNGVPGREGCHGHYEQYLHCVEARSRGLPTSNLAACPVSECPLVWKGAETRSSP